jgi:hypothetical protein
MSSTNCDESKIVRSIERVLSNRNIDLLTKEAYTFIHLYCGSIAHFSLEGWKHTYRDLRDFINFFLVRNEYGCCLVDPPEFMNLTQKNRHIIQEIVSVCQDHREQIVDEINQREAEIAREVGRKLVSGELSLSELFRRRPEIEQAINTPRKQESDLDPTRNY